MKVTLSKIPVLCFLFVFINVKVHAQATDGLPATGNVYTAAKFLGWGNTSGDLFFRTNNTNRMVLKNTTGFVGINTLLPNQQLHVVGEINLQTGSGTPNTGYRINNFPVLQVKNIRNTFIGINAGLGYNGGGNDNTFVGYNSGAANVTGIQNSFYGSNSGPVNSTGTRNTFIGVQAGFTNTIGNRNTCVGERAGASNVSGNSNTYVGSYAAHTGISTASYNTFLGLDAGHDVLSGGDNTILGAEAGYNINSGVQNVIAGRYASFSMNDASNNVFIGWESALQNIGGDRNVFVGSRTGRNQFGDYCTFIGYQAGYDNTVGTYTLTNASGIGASAIPTTNNKMILGDNNVNVGIGLSNDVANGGPQNKLEIDAGINGMNPSPAATVGASGLRFRDLHSANSTVPNPGQGILALDALGNVIYVPSPSGAGFGNLCGATANPLTNHFGIPLANFNYYFEGQGYKNNAVSIGLPCAQPLKSKLTVFEQNGVLSNIQSDIFMATLTAINDYSGAISQQFKALHAESVLNDPNGVGNRILHIAGDFYANGGWQNYGVKSLVISGNNTINYGGHFTVTGGIGSRNYGLYASVVGSTSGATNIGIYAEADPYTGSTPPSPFATPNNYAGYFSGTVVRTGNDNFTSDLNLKENIDSIVNANQVLSQLKPKSFEFKTSQFPSMSLPTGKQYGLIAQDVENVLPELVSNIIHPERIDTAGNVIYPSVSYKSLNYQALIPYLIRGHQEQENTIDSLKICISQLANVINSCCASSIVKNGNQNENLEKLPTYNVNIGNDDLPMLAQNIPNPYGNTTNIQFNIPKNAQSAQIVFFNEQGMILNSVEINTKGRGQINLNAEKLENGLYFYSLIIDGKKVDTKKMVKAE